MIYDTTKQQFDLAFVDLVADVTGAEDKQTAGVDLKESNLVDLWRSEAPNDPRKQGVGYRAGMRARADTLRRRAREFQLGALPTSAGRDPGPLGTESQPTTRAEPLEPLNPEAR
jgi:hypothetical protein